MVARIENSSSKLISMDFERRKWVVIIAIFYWTIYNNFLRIYFTFYIYNTSLCEVIQLLRNVKCPNVLIESVYKTMFSAYSYKSVAMTSAKSMPVRKVFRYDVAPSSDLWQIVTISDRDG